MLVISLTLGLAPFMIVAEVLVSACSRFLPSPAGTCPIADVALERRFAA